MESGYKPALLAVLLAIAACAPGAALVGTGVTSKAAYQEKEFVGSRACAQCHQVEYQSWQESYHSKMVRSKEDGLLRGAAEKWETDGTSPGPKVGNVTGKEFKLSDVKHVIGSYWKQRFLVPNDQTGNHQFMDKQFNRMSGKWEPYGQKNDWEFMCVTCHATGYRLVAYDPQDLKAQKATWVEENVGCESCHGPGAQHAQTPKAQGGIWNPAKQSKADQSRACGYCHIRLENENFKTPQGNFREDFPAPKLGDTFRPWDDWTKWYPEHAIIPGVHAEDKIDAEYKGDLKGMFLLDDVSRKAGVFEEGKHHQEYQGFLQSKHHQSGAMTCSDCHNPHRGKNIKPVVARESCTGCHQDQFDFAKIMPGTAGTAKDLTVRTHTFRKDQSRPSRPTASGAPEYAKKK